MEEPAHRAGRFDHALWRTSTKCANGACVEIAFSEDLVALRDSKDRGGPMLVFSSSEWQVFTDSARRGEFDLPR